tara:strand:- start:366 stop:608 length:243 start_codon:yes stop_codon:yes gene_type:complete
MNDNEVYWRCRRGMLELDLFLIPYFESKFAQLNANLQNSFINLLDLPDPDLLNLLMNYKKPDKKFESIIHLIREYKLGKF